MTRRSWTSKPPLSDSKPRRPAADATAGIPRGLASVARFVRSHFTCYLIAHPDYGAAVEQAERALRPQVAGLLTELVDRQNGACTGDAAILCTLHGFVSHYAERNHIRAAEGQVEVTDEVLLCLFGERAGPLMIEQLESRLAEPAAADWVREGHAMAGAAGTSGSAALADLIAQRLKSLEQEPAAT